MYFTCDTCSRVTTSEFPTPSCDMASARGARSSAVPRRTSARKTTSCSRLTPDVAAVVAFNEPVAGAVPAPDSTQHAARYTLLIMESEARVSMEDCWEQIWGLEIG